MIEQLNTQEGDIAYWGLTRVQAITYYSRLATYHAARSQHYADLAVAYAAKASVLSNIAVGLALLGVAFAVVSMLARGAR